MRFTDLFIKRPVFSAVLSLLLLFAGFIAFNALPLRQFPTITPSVISVHVSYTGASASVMEGFITTPIEGAVSSVRGLDYIASHSAQGSTSVNIHLKLGTDIDKALTDISDKVSSVRWQFPKSANDPVITKNDPNAQPQVFISFTSDTLSPGEVTDHIVRVVQPTIRALDGVGDVVLLGDYTYAMRIWLNPQWMAAQQVTAEEVLDALKRNNIQAAAGRIQSQWQEFDVTASTDLSTPEQFKRLVVRNDKGHLVRLKDVANIVLGSTTQRSSALLNGKKGTVIGVQSKTTANPLSVAQQVYAALPEIKRNLPAGLKAHVMWDSTKFIRASLEEVVSTLVEAIVIVVLVIFLSLGSVRAVLIPVLAIPLSLMGVCIFMLMLGFSLNTLTFLAAVLAIGLVVDDAIVVVENIHRHVAEGKTATEAAILGAREISFAIIAMTLTLAAVFVPIGFTTGLVGRLFREFAFTLAGTVIISGFVALTLSPMMCAKLLSKDMFNKPLPRVIDRVYQAITHAYRQVLSSILGLPAWLVGGLVVAVLAVSVAANLFFVNITPPGLAPSEDQGALMVIAQAPTPANLAYTQRYSQQLEPIFKSVPEMEGYAIVNGWPSGVNSALSFLILKPWQERTRNVQQILMSIMPKVMGITGLRAFPINLPPLPVSGNMPVGFVVKSTGSYEQLFDLMQKLKFAAMKNPGLLNVNVPLKLDKPNVHINIDRAKAGDLGISMASISTTLNLLLSAPDVGKFTMRGRAYNVVPQLASEFRDNPEKLNDVYVRSAQGQMVPMSTFITAEEKVGPTSLSHFQQMRAATLQASLAPGYSLGEALEFLRTQAQGIFPKGTEVDYSGESREFMFASNAMKLTMLYAVVFIFLVLSAQFESFIDAFIILLTVLFSFLGAMSAIHFKQFTLNIYTQIGLVSLIGLISKHGILMVEFAHQLQTEGMDRLSAIAQAAVIRLRPILMTTFAMVLAALPLVFASGAGAVSRSQIGWVIVCGMSVGTLFTLLFFPALYISVHRMIGAFKSVLPGQQPEQANHG